MNPNHRKAFSLLGLNIGKFYSTLAWLKDIDNTWSLHDSVPRYLKLGKKLEHDRNWTNYKIRNDRKNQCWYQQDCTHRCWKMQKLNCRTFCLYPIWIVLRCFLLYTKRMKRQQDVYKIILRQYKTFIWIICVIELAKCAKTKRN